MSARRRQPTTPEGMRLKREDRDTLGTWTVYGVYLDGVRIGSISGPDTAGWSCSYGPDAEHEVGITPGWSAPPTRYEACWKLRDHHRAQLRATKTTGETR